MSVKGVSERKMTSRILAQITGVIYCNGRRLKKKKDEEKPLKAGEEHEENP